MPPRCRSSCCACCSRRSSAASATTATPGRRARHHRHQPRPRARSSQRHVPPGPLLPHQRLPADLPPLRERRDESRCWRTTSCSSTAARWARRLEGFSPAAMEGSRLRLAGQRPRAGERAGAGRGAGAERPDPAREPAPGGPPAEPAGSGPRRAGPRTGIRCRSAPGGAAAGGT